MKRVVLVHGWQGSPTAAWRPWLKQQLEAQGVEVIAPQMPNPDFPRCYEWVSTLQEHVGQADEHVFFVGHSLGCIATLRYIESLPQDQRIGGAVLVAGFTSNLGYAAMDDFVCNPINWTKIKQHCGDFVAIHSKDDYIVSTHYGQDIFQKQLGARYVETDGYQHFAEEDNVTELPIVFEHLLELVPH